MADHIEESGVLTVAQRFKRGQQLKRIKGKLKLGRAKAEKKIADSGHLNTRSRRMAVKLLRKRLAGKIGQDYDSLSPSQKIQVDKKIAGKSKIIGKLATRLLPKVKQKELQRFKDRAQHKANESVVLEQNPNAGAGLEGTHEVVKKYQDVTPGQGGPIPMGNRSLDTPVMSFKQYRKRFPEATVHESVGEKELKRSTFEEHQKHVTPTNSHIVAFPSSDHIEKDKLKSMIGKPTHTSPLGDAWHYTHKDKPVELTHNTSLNRWQVSGRREDKEELHDFRKKMVHAYDKKNPGTVDKIKKSWSSVPGKDSY